MTTCAFKILQIYSDRHGASLASQASRNLQREFDRSECFETTWNTELLRSPKLRMLAAREAAIRLLIGRLPDARERGRAHSSVGAAEDDCADAERRVLDSRKQTADSRREGATAVCFLSPAVSLS